MKVMTMVQMKRRLRAPCNLVLTTLKLDRNKHR
jgi:hypothetical protein